MKDFEDYGVSELSINDCSIIDGGNEIAEDVGYAIGYTVGLILGAGLVATKMVLEAIFK